MTDAAQPHRSWPWYKRPWIWIAGVVLVALAAFGFMEMGSGRTAIHYSDFLDQLDTNNVASVTFTGTQIDGRFRNPVTEPAANKGAVVTAFRSRVPGVGDPTLLPELRAKHVPFGIASSQWFGLGTGGAAILGVLVAFLLAKPMLLVVGAALVVGLVRVARGGKLDIHSILSQVPMFRSVSGQSDEKKSSTGPSPRPGD